MIVICETWLNSSFTDSELFDNRYFVYRRDRESSGFHSGRSGGGVLVAVSKRWPSYRLANFESKCEDVWVGLDIKINNKLEQLFICGVYLPSPLQKHVLEHFIANTNNVLVNSSHSLIMGDFNLSCIRWSGTPNLPLDANCDQNSTHADLLLDFISFNDLMQYNHVTNNKNKILDLILSNLPIDNVHNCISPLTRADLYHPPLEFEINRNISNICMQPNSNLIYKFYKADYESIIKHLKSVEWDVEFCDCLSIDAMVDKFYNIIHETIKQHVPRSAPSSSRRYPVWFNKATIHVLREKLKYRKRYSKYKNPLDLLSFQLLRERSIAMINNGYKKYLSAIESTIKNNPKLFWSFIKQKNNKNSSGYPSRMYYKNLSTTNGPEICELFAQCFSSIYQTNNASSSSKVATETAITSNFIDNIVFTPDEIKLALIRLDTRKGAGSDCISPLFAVKCADVLAWPLSLIFNKSLNLGVFPSHWKEARIVPVYKSGDKSNIENFRPISILPVFGKVFESLICSLIYWHVRHLIIPQQHGFVRSRSTATNLVSFVSDIVDAVDSRASADVIYTDFSKAFDLVNIKILTEKLAKFGITGNLLKWCHSYLLDRRSKVVVNGYESKVYITSSGVPQGSHLGPLFFNLFINDVTSCFHYSQCYLYADDLKIVKHIVDNTDVKLLQEDLDRFVIWCEDNILKLNTNKCYFMHFSRKKTPHFSSYKLRNHLLREVDAIRDLGVIVDNKLTFKAHIDSIVNRSFKLLGFVLRNCKDFKSAHSKICVFNCLVRTVLEYCSTAWTPKYDIHKKRIESVNKRFLWHLAFQHFMAKKLPSYKQRLAHFKLQNLESRRDVTDLKFLHKLVNGQLDCPLLVSKVKFNIPRKLPRFSRYVLFATKPFKSNLGHFSSVNRMQNMYNKSSKGNNIDIFSKLGTFVKSITS